MAKFFNAERASLILVNRYQKEMYRVYFDKEASEFKMRIYGFDKGIAGHVASSGQTNFIDSVDDDNRFCKEIDDP